MSDLVWTAFGDSTGVGIGGRRGGYVEIARALLEARGHRVRVVNACICGGTSEDVVDAARRSGPSDIATIAVGVNDLRRLIAAPAFAARCAEAVRVLRSKTRGPIVVANVPDASHAPIVPRPMRSAVSAAIDAYNEALAHALQTRELSSAAYLLDLHAHTREILGGDGATLFCADGFHPSDAGYRAWGALLAPALERLLPTSSGAALDA